MVRLSPGVQKFVLHWGEMGTRWGVNRTVAQVHALLYLWPRPLNAEEIAQTLSIARSNVSTSLRELQSWGIVKAVHLLGERREHYESMKDVWEMFRVVLDERKRREVDPTLAVVRECVGELQKPDAADAVVRRRLLEMLEFLEAMTSLYSEMRRAPTNVIRNLWKAKSRLRKLLGAASPD
jgi:DNA-binding transcriptional regulator GbsR (MarR family)